MVPAVLFCQNSNLDIEKFPALKVFDSCPVIEIQISQNEIKPTLVWPPEIYIKGRDIITVLVEMKKFDENIILIVCPDDALPFVETLKYLKQLRTQSDIRLFLVDDGKNKYFFELAK